MSYCVYKHTFPNGKVYIGTTCKKPEERWDSGKGYIGQDRMVRAIIEYGWDNVKHEVLFDGLTKKEAEQKEIELIAEYKSNNAEFGYNARTGGSVNNYEDYVIRLNSGTLLYKNQQAVEIHKPNNSYYDIQNDLIDAVYNLDFSSFKLYLRLYFCDDGEQIILNHLHLCPNMEMKERTYYLAKKELINKNYLVCRHGNMYDFYTRPHDVNDIIEENDGQ